MTVISTFEIYPLRYPVTSWLTQPRIAHQTPQIPPIKEKRRDN